MKIKSVKLTAYVMARRDELNKEAVETMLAEDKVWQQAQEQFVEQMKLAKTRYHKAKIETNALKREALMLQELLNEELELEVKTEQENISAWDFKSQSHIAAEMLETEEDQHELMSMIAKSGQ